MLIITGMSYIIFKAAQLEVISLQLNRNVWLGVSILSHPSANALNRSAPPTPSPFPLQKEESQFFRSCPFFLATLSTRRQFRIILQLLTLSIKSVCSVLCCSCCTSALYPVSILYKPTIFSVHLD